ncbi:hypothetical protein Q1695_005870 [Nippostrongylus brasiliensis]|nr:hypothetical protein Q1695_005870 [Nippostrongylus brasiliensis]
MVDPTAPSHLETVETFELPTVMATLPIHIFNFLFVLVAMASIIVTKHLHSRPQRLLAISCAFFLIASVYDLAFDISYLVIINKTVTVQQCSIMRNFAYNPIATQAFVDALERFLIVFFNYDMSLTIVFLLYTAFPLVSIGLAFYNSFVSYTFITSDDVCAMVRRTKWTNIALVTIQWGSAAIAVLMYVAVWKQVRRKHKTKIPEPTCKGAPHHQKMGTERYYWDPKVVLIFFICCVLPLILAVPSLALTIANDFEWYQNNVANVLAIAVLDMTTPVTWALYICYIGHIRRSFIDCVLCRARRIRPSSPKSIITTKL